MQNFKYLEPSYFLILCQNISLYTNMQLKFVTKKK